MSFCTSSSVHPLSALATLGALCVAGLLCVGCGTTPDDNPSLDGGAGGVGGTASITGTYGTEPVKPVLAAYWIEFPADPAEGANGPLIYLFGASISCDQLSMADWGDTIPAGTQLLEMIVGTTTPDKAVPAAASAAADVAEVNYIHGGNPDDTRATSGSVTLTAYTKDVAVAGTVDVKFPTGDVKGSFNAKWCPDGQEH
ncbi:MAG: hypothetical protein WKG00_17450 [Polyangiaceae bacterium]